MRAIQGPKRSRASYGPEPASGPTKTLWIRRDDATRMIPRKLLAPSLICLCILSLPTPVGFAGASSPSSRRLLTLDTAIAEATKLPRLHSLLASVRGELVLERYFNGTKPTRLANIKSVSKSVVSALVGIAIEQRKIPNVKQPISHYFTFPSC